MQRCPFPAEIHATTGGIAAERMGIQHGICSAASSPHCSVCVCDLPRFFCRRGGDIIVIGLEKESGMQRGRVIAVLKAGELAPYG